MEKNGNRGMVMQGMGKRSLLGFSLIEMMVAFVAGGLLVTALFKLWHTNDRHTSMIANKSDFRDRATLATTQINRSITMAGFGMSKMEVLRRGYGATTDTLVLHSNHLELRTTLIDSAVAGAAEIRIFNDSGFAVDGFIAITDSLKHEYNRIASIEADNAEGFIIGLSGGLAHSYSAGVPDIYPVKREKYYADSVDRELVHFVNDHRRVLAKGITGFRLQFLDQSGSPATAHKDIRVVTFSLTGTYKAPVGMPSQMSFSSTVIPRNIL